MNSEFELLLDEVGLTKTLETARYIAFFSGTFQFLISWFFTLVLLRLIKRHLQIHQAKSDINVKSILSESGPAFYHSKRTQAEWFSMLGFLGSIVGLVSTTKSIEILKQGDDAEKAAQLASGFSLAMSTTIFGIVATLIVSKLILGLSTKEATIFQGKE